MLRVSIINSRVGFFYKSGPRSTLPHLACAAQGPNAERPPVGHVVVSLVDAWRGFENFRLRDFEAQH